MVRSRKHDYPFDKATQQDIENLLRLIIKPVGFPVDQPHIAIDLLEHLITIIRYKHQLPTPAVSYETFLNSGFRVKNKQIVITDSQQNLTVINVNNSGTPPIQLQPALLRFLLLYQDQNYPVHKIVKNFIASVWADLHPLDFKRTTTGAIRCHTNTRFAASSLRDHGLLKFSNKEAYKTWKLSLPGMIVAAEIVEKGIWHPYHNMRCGIHLHEDIKLACKRSDSYHGFINELNRFCDPQKDIFETFKRILELAFNIWKNLWDVVSDSKLKAGERRLKCLELINELDKHEDIDKFYKEFSISMLNSELLKKYFHNHRTRGD